MSHAPVRHLGHQLLHGITRRAGHDIARHDLVDAARQQLGATVGERDDDVALGQDAVDALAIRADDNRADALAIECLDSLGDRRAGPDRRDPAAFVAQDCLDIHRGPPRPERAAPHTRGSRSRRRLPKDRTKCRSPKGAGLSVRRLSRANG